MGPASEEPWATRPQGTLIPDLDRLLAAPALHYDLTLLMRHLRPFQRLLTLQLDQPRCLSHEPSPTEGFGGNASFSLHIFLYIQARAQNVVHDRPKARADLIPANAGFLCPLSGLVVRLKATEH